jgi:glycosyltransferase involved in cell wall biosynthesis
MEPRLPRISVGLPVFNGERYIASAVASVLDQSATDFELIVSDNCSTDRSSEICADLARQDPRIRYVRNEQNLGVAGNVEKIFAAARGEYFMFLGHDDLLGESYLEALCATLDARPDAVLAFGTVRSIDAAGNHRRDYPEIFKLAGRSSLGDRLNAFLWSEEAQGKANIWHGLFRARVFERYLRSYGLRALGSFGQWGNDNLAIFAYAQFGVLVAAPRAVYYKRYCGQAYNLPDLHQHFHEMQGYFQGYRNVIQSIPMADELRDLLVASVSLREALWYQREFGVTFDDAYPTMAHLIQRQDSGPRAQEGAAGRPNRAAAEQPT